MKTDVELFRETLHFMKIQNLGAKRELKGKIFY